MGLVDEAIKFERSRQRMAELKKYFAEMDREFAKHSKGIIEMDTPEEDVAITPPPKVTEQDMMDAEKSFQFWSGFFTALEDRERDSTEIGQQAIAAARQVLREKYEELCRLTIKFSEQ